MNTGIVSLRVNYLGPEYLTLHDLAQCRWHHVIDPAKIGGKASTMLLHMPVSSVYSCPWARNA